MFEIFAIGIFALFLAQPNKDLEHQIEHLQEDVRDLEDDIYRIEDKCYEANVNAAFGSPIPFK